MGNFLSSIPVIIREFLALLSSYKDISKRLNASPGLPVPNPTLSFWTIPNSPIAKHLSDLPPHADIIIIGSGITGASFARTVLDHGSNGPLQVVMLDARDVCSGASGRNGGHVNPQLYVEYAKLKKNYGQEMAKKIIKFRLSHFSEMKRVSEEEGILEETQCRAVEHCDVYYVRKQFKSAMKSFEVFKADLPEEAAGIQVYESKEAIEKFHVAPDVIGCFANHGGAINPYRLVTGVLSRLLSRYPENFRLLTNTPCTSISAPTSATPYYTLTTSRGKITAPHIIHATNAHAAHLIPSLRSKLVPARGTMTAQRPGLSLGTSTLQGLRSFIFYRAKIGYDYLTQLPNGEQELIFGGVGIGGDELLYQEIANPDDSGYDPTIAAYLSGVLPLLFGPKNWGAEKPPAPQNPDGTEGVMWNEGRVKACWSGSVCISADWLPWVGRIPVKLTRRPCPPVASTPTIGVSKTVDDSKDAISPAHSVLTSAPGEWISASYSGEGMVHAWLCAKALAYMVLGAEKEGRVEEWFPDVLKVTEARWKKANIEHLLQELGSD